jgi:hypothetical protein
MVRSPWSPRESEFPRPTGVTHSAFDPQGRTAWPRSPHLLIESWPPMPGRRRPSRSSTGGCCAPRRHPPPLQLGPAVTGCAEATTAQRAQVLSTWRSGSTPAATRRCSCRCRSGQRSCTGSSMASSPLGATGANRRRWWRLPPSTACSTPDGHIGGDKGHGYRHPALTDGVGGDRRSHGRYGDQRARPCPHRPSGRPRYSEPGRRCSRRRDAGGRTRLGRGVLHDDPSRHAPRHVSGDIGLVIVVQAQGAADLVRGARAVVASRLHQRVG